MKGKSFLVLQMQWIYSFASGPYFMPFIGGVGVLMLVAACVLRK